MLRRRMTEAHVVLMTDGACALDDGARRPSRALVSAALYGLLSSAALGALGCGSTEAADGGDDGERRITETRIVPDMTLERFTTDCDARGGAVELHAHCGGANTCRGFSYDDVTLELTEHTCRGLNTCSGYSCVVPSES